MFSRTVDELEKRTQEYWNISSARCITSPIIMSVGQAIEGCNTLLSNLDPHRALARRTRYMSNSIVAGRKRKLKIPAALFLLEGHKHA